jgi:two-component system, cell cycle response regulator DivK
MLDQLIGLHILIVEDNPANLLLIKAVLERSGCRLSVAGSAEEVIQSIADEPPDAILMDIQLPGQDGLSLTRQLKAAPSTRHIPVIALTAHAMKDDRERAFAAGCDGYLAKPISVRTFSHELSAILRAARSASE